MGTTRPGCSFRLQAEPRRRRGVGLQAAHLLLPISILFLLSACAPHHPVDDLTLSTKVKIELLADPALGALRLDVSTLNGVVTLSGTVPSRADADRAVSAAKRVAGVREAKSALKIAGG